MHNICIDCGIDISKRAKKCRKCSKLGHSWPKGYYERQSKAQKKRFADHPQWNEGKHWEHLQRENNAQWKGENAKIKTIHVWVKLHKGRPKLCSNCGTTQAKAYDWANIDHTYKRNLEDFIRLCRSCHRKYDYKFNNYRAK